jgi:hypothetical protein
MSRQRLAADSLLLLLAAATAAICLGETNTQLRLLLVLVSACLVPGGAMLTRLPVEDPLEAIGLAASLGFCIEALGALAMVWTGWWHPFGWAATVLAVASLVLALDIRRIVVTVRRQA